MTRSINLLTALCILGLAGCTRTEDDAARHESREQPKLPPQTQQAPVRPPAPFDLGGPCGSPGVSRGLALTGRREEELRKNERWDELIDGAKQDVRSNCSIPFRWQKLFTVLVSGHRYEDAVKVAAETTRRGFPFPHAVLANADAAFLASDAFKLSEIGTAYAIRESEDRQNLRLAEERLSKMEPKYRPANPYRSIGACPFECCTYREWTTKSAVRLQDAIDSGTIIADIPARTRVQASTGEVRVEPRPYAVLANHGVLKAGEVIFFLDNLGEGHVNYWYEGKLNPDLGLDDGLFSYTTKGCNANAASRWGDPCWLHELQPDKTFLNEWWVSIRTSNGKVGWVLNTGQFENADACG